jgi:broad specificity phosphatase PhoE
MKKVYLVRHGETNANIHGIVQGATEELSPTGIVQARILADRLKNINFTNLVVSDYVRTRQTVDFLLPFTNCVPEYTALVRETKQPSSLVGVSNSSEEFLQYYDEATVKLSDPHWRFSDEETFYDVVERVKKFFLHIDTLEGDTVVVTHGRFIIYVVMFVLSGEKLDYAIWNSCRHGFQTSNTGITTIAYNERYESWKLVTFNDQAHFAE